jgi:hypothetical protein
MDFPPSRCETINNEPTRLLSFLGGLILDLFARLLNAATTTIRELTGLSFPSKKISVQTACEACRQEEVSVLTLYMIS